MRRTLSTRISGRSRKRIGWRGGVPLSPGRRARTRRCPRHRRARCSRCRWPAGIPARADGGELRVEHFGVVDGARRERERAHPARAIGLDAEADAAVRAAQRARQLGGAGAFEERQVLGRGAVVHVGGRRERAELEGERREAGVGDPGVVDARRAFGARAAELEQQAVVEIARDGAFDAEARAAEIEASLKSRAALFSRLAQCAHRAAAEIGGQRAFGASPYIAPSSCTLARKRDRRAAVGGGDGRAVVGEARASGTSCVGDLRLAELLA